MPAATNQIQFATQTAQKIRALANQTQEAITELNNLEAKRQNGDFDFSNVDFSTTPGLGFVDDSKLRDALSSAQSLYGGGDFNRIRSVSTAG
jgi:hypothetical protein